MRWQVCLEDSATGTLMARVHRGTTFTKGGAIHRQNRLNAKLWQARWTSVRAVIVPAMDTRHLPWWKVSSIQI